jgi:acyl-CoA thioester hydrolase
MDFFWPVRIYYEDTDSGGVVYYANYLKFMERARTEWLRSKGYEQDTLINDQGLLFAVRSVAIDYIQPAKFNDYCVVQLRLEGASRIGLTFAQFFYKANVSSVKGLTDADLAQQIDDKTQFSLLSRATVKIVSLDSNSLKPKRIPNSMLEEITGEH